MTYPLLLKLPTSFLKRRISAQQALILEARSRVGRSAVHAFMAGYRLSPDEVRFARDLADRHDNLWFFRTHQQQRVGDFAVVDVSSPDLTRRVVWVVELKMGAPITSGRGAGNQLEHAARVVPALAAEGVAEGVVARLVVGDGRELVRRWNEV